MTTFPYHQPGHHQSMSQPTPDRANVLLGIALLGMVSAPIVQRLWLPNRSLDRAQALVRRLTADGLVTPRYAYAGGRHGPPQRRGCWWTLTKAGLEHARLLSGEDVQTVGVRSGVEVHDGMVVDTVAALIDQGRQQRLSSVVVQREARLLEHARKPCADALVILRQHADAMPRMVRVPWSMGKAILGETAIRLWLEADNDTEDAHDIVGKAMVYQQTTQAYRDAGRPVPVVAWVAPTAKRRDWLNRLWQQAWPGGSWLLATTDEVQEGTWWQYSVGQLQAVRLFT
jgi:hypothetical protein